jgi:hypothetical protein
MTSDAGRPRLETEGASTLVLFSLVAMTGSWLIFLLPYPALSRLFHKSIGIYDVLVICSAAGASIWVALFLLVRHRFQGRRQARMLAYAKPPPSSVPAKSELHHLFQQGQTELRLLGDPDFVVDPGGRVTASPRVIPAARLGNCRYIVLLPALAFTRLRGDSEALDAVLAHELAHVLHRDLRMLAGSEVFLRVTLWFVPIAVAIAVVGSAMTDIAAGEDTGAALLASILGKSSIAVLPLLIVLSIAMLRFAESYREALADAFAVKVVGAAALARAERVLSANDQGARAWSAFDPIVVLYAWQLIAMFGFAIGALYGYLPSPLAYWHSTLPTTSSLRLPLSVAFATVGTLVMYGAVFGLAYILTSDRSSRAITTDTVCSRLALFVTFAVIGGLVTQTLPLMLSAAPIFDRFPDVARHDAFPLLIADLADSVTSIVACTAVGTMCAMMAKSGRARLWFLLGGVVMLAGQVEPALAPQYTFGLASFFFGTILLAGPAWNVLKRAKTASPTTIAMALVAAFIIGGSWFGLGGPGCIATSLEAAAEVASANGDAHRAIYFATLATRFSRLNAAGFLELARLQLASQTFSRDAITSTEQALRAPYLHNWNERFDALVAAATAHLERRDPSDWVLARDYLASARDLWRRNTRLDPQNGVILHYNGAVVACHEGKDELTALTDVVAALGLVADDAKSAEIARMATEDPDLACMSLYDMARPTASTIEFLRGARGTTENAISQALAHGIDRQEAVRFLRLVIRARAEA